MSVIFSVAKIPTAPVGTPEDRKTRTRALNYAREHKDDLIFGSVHRAFLERNADVEVLSVLLHPESGRVLTAQLALSTDLQAQKSGLTAPSAPVYPEWAALSQTALNAEAAQRLQTRHGSSQDGLLVAFRLTGNVDEDAAQVGSFSFLTSSEGFRPDAVSAAVRDEALERLNQIVRLGPNWRDETRLAIAPPERVEDMAKEKLALERRMLQLAAEETDPWTFLRKAHEVLKQTPKLALQMTRAVWDEFAKRIERIGASVSDSGFGIYMDLRDPAAQVANDNIPTASAPDETSRQTVSAPEPDRQP